VLPPVQHGGMVIEPAQVLQGRVTSHCKEVLVCWKGVPAADTSWVELEEFKRRFPEFQVEDKLLFQGGKDVMYSKTYARRHRRQES
jgi:transcriptional regulator GlxA family with amidase domain